MARFFFFNQEIELPGDMVAQMPTIDKKAWLGQRYISVQLSQDMIAMRFHTNGKSLTSRLASRLSGDWYYVGDIIHTRSEIVALTAIPGDFSQQATVKLRAGTILNVGLAAEKFGSSGGGAQAEFVQGWQEEYSTVGSGPFSWSNRVGSS